MNKCPNCGYKEPPGTKPPPTPRASYGDGYCRHCHQHFTAWELMQTCPNGCEDQLLNKYGFLLTIAPIVAMLSYLVYRILMKLGGQ